MTDREDPSARVVFINRYFHPDSSATSQLLTDLALALEQTGIEVHVICSRQRYDDPDANLAARAIVSGVQVHRVWTTRFGRGSLGGRAVDYAAFYASSGWSMIKLLRRGDVVVAKTDPPLISIVAMAAAKFTGARLVNWLQDLFPEVASELGVGWLPVFLAAPLRRARDLSLRFAESNVVIGERMRAKVESLGIASERVQVVGNWAEPGPSMPKPAASSALRQSLGLSARFVVGYSGNLGRAHEFQTLIGAAELLADDSDIVFLMIGGGSGMAELRNAVAARGLKNFHFLPYQPRDLLADSLAASDVHWVSLRPELEGLIVPSKFYGILAAARPVIFIGDSDGELAQAIRDAGCGAQVGVGASGALAELLLDLKSDPVRCERQGENGYRRYCNSHGSHRAFDQWRQILKRPIRAGAASSPTPSDR